MRILLSSNAPWSATGYGVQVKSLLPRLAALPVVGGAENLAVFAWYGLQGGAMQLGPMRCYPGHTDPYGNDVIGHHARDHRADVVITLIDVWTQKDTANRVRPARWLPWFPVDADPVPPLILDSITHARLPLVYSKFGERQLREAGAPCAYVPIGLETAVFCILEDRTAVQEFRRHLFPDGDHIAVMVAANKGWPDRKAFQVQLRAWAAFADDKPHARLYLHTDPTTAAGGADLQEMVRSLAIADKVKFCDRYQYYLGYPETYMALLYNAADVLLGASMAEGFGIPLIEAQACGCPVVTTDFSSMPELVQFGRVTKPADLFWSYIGSWWAWPDWQAIRDALEELHTMQREERTEHAWSACAQMASQLVHKEYGWDVVVDRYWRKVLESVAHG